MTRCYACAGSGFQKVTSPLWGLILTHCYLCLGSGDMDNRSTVDIWEGI